MAGSEKIAESVIGQMVGQIELFTSLSIGICGALLLLAMQIMLHNRDSGKEPLRVRCFYLWAIAFILEGASTCAGALAYASITSVTPSIFHLDFSKTNNWTAVSFDGYVSLKVAAMAQFSLFFLGVLSIFFFVIANRKNLTGEVHREKRSQGR
jgi:hypothetical protein